MFCGQCGSPIQFQNNFCTKCGAPASESFAGKLEDEYYRIRCKGKSLDYMNHSELSAMFTKVKEDRILIDLCKVEFIDSVGIGSLVTLIYKTNRTKQEVKFIITSESIMKSIKALGVDNVLEIYEEEQAARTSWGLPSI
ncbi:MAG: STAS domain-containing protein [bacterium]